MAVICDSFVFLQLQKTASTAIGEIIADLFDGTYVDPKHGRFPEVQKYVIGSVRNPWDYYVSLWAYGCAGRGSIYHRLTRDHHNRFVTRIPARLRPVRSESQAWRRMYSDVRNRSLFREWLTEIHEPPYAAKLDIRPERQHDGGKAFPTIAGYATYRYCRLFVSDVSYVLQAQNTEELLARAKREYRPSAMVRMENLADDLIAAVQRVGCTVDDALAHQIRERATVRRNTSSHFDYTDYYDDETRLLVRRHDALIIEQHGYVFGAEAEDQRLLEPPAVGP